MLAVLLPSTAASRFHCRYPVMASGLKGQIPIPWKLRAQVSWSSAMQKLIKLQTVDGRFLI